MSGGGCRTCDDGVVIDPGATECRRCRSLRPPTPAPPEMSRLARSLETVFAEIRSYHPELPPFLVVVASGTEGTGTAHWGQFASHRWVVRSEGRVDASYAEIKISGEGLDRPPLEVLATMLHEATHALAHARGVKDVSNGGRYHNERFAMLAHELGLTPPKVRDPRHGFSAATAGPRVEERYSSALIILAQALTMYRAGAVAKAPARGPRDGKRVKVTCGCGRSLQVTPAVLEQGPIQCGTCRTEFCPAGA